MTRDILELLSRILGRCLVGGLLLVTIWYLGYMSGAVCGIHALWFGLSPHECSLLSYGGMGIVKMMVLVLFFLPWLAIRMELRRTR